MKPRIAFVVAAVTASIALVVVALLHARATAAAGDSLAKLSPRQEELTRQLALTRQRLAKAGAEQRSLQEKVNAKQAAPKAAEPASAKVQVLDPKMAAVAEALSRTPWRDVVLEKNPELQSRYLAMKRRDLGVAYGPFLAEFGLPPDQAARFLNIKLAAAENTMDLNSTSRARGLTESDPAVQAMRRQSDETMQAAERELLGEAGYQQLGEYERTLPMRDFVGDLAASLVFSGDSISAAQANQLTQILAEASETYRQGARAPPPWADLQGAISARQPARGPIDTEAVLARARTVLSPTQYASLEAHLSSNRALVDLFNVIRQAPGDPIVNFTFVGRN